jgi:BioD-like phosphotransacetylase family protein
LISIILTCGRRLLGEALGAEAAVVVAAAEVARADLPDQVAAVLAVVAADAAFAGVVREAAIRAPWFSARMALADSAPKLMAEMLNTLAL